MVTTLDAGALTVIFGVVGATATVLEALTVIFGVVGATATVLEPDAPPVLAYNVAPMLRDALWLSLFLV